MDQWTNGPMEQWTNGPKNGPKNGPTNGPTHGPMINRRVCPRLVRRAVDYEQPTLELRQRDSVIPPVRDYLRHASQQRDPRLLDADEGGV